MPIVSPDSAIYYKKEKRRSLYLLLVLLLEAFALPITTKTSNAEAHADMIYDITIYVHTQITT